MINLKQLLTESAEPKAKIIESADLVRSGLEKVFAAGDREISYRRCENVGLGYVKNISEAIKIANEQSQVVAKSFGYKPDDTNAKYIKEDGEMSDFDRGEFENGKPPVSTPGAGHAQEESREIEIGKEILNHVSRIYSDLGTNPFPLTKKKLQEIETLAKELISMHGTQ